MNSILNKLALAAFPFFVAQFAASGAEPLHVQIDAIVEKAAGDVVLSPLSSDAEFLRRAHLDFAGDIPSAETVRAFLADKDPNKRSKLVDRLLAAKTYAPHLADQFSILLMERRGENEHWRRWIESSFAENKPWDQLVREIVRADHRDEPSRGAAFFYTKRLEKYGQNPTDYPGLTRDVGRLFLGLDLQCAECHNHRSVKSYKQADFQGLFAAFKNLRIYGGIDYPAVEEGIIEGRLEFASVFTGRKKTTAPKIPGLEEITVKSFEKEEAYEVAPDKKSKTPGIPKFSPLAEFARRMPESATFAPNIANRLWFLLIGRGIVEPLDLFHPENPPSNPDLLNLLGDAFAKSGYDIKGFLRELALTDVYQRSGRIPPGANVPPDQHFAVGLERRLSAEQMFRALLTATGNTADHLGKEKTEALKKKYFDAFAGEPKLPELGFAASLKGALLLLNDEDFAGLFSPQNENLAAKLAADPDDAKVAEELYLHIFSRLPTEEEHSDIVSFLKEKPSERTTAITDLIWAMVTSTEFVTNH